MVRRADRDEGFTLTELTVALALIGAMLAVVFAGMKAVYDGQAASDRQAWFAREIGAPLDQLEQVFSQNTQIESATDHSVVLMVDRPMQVGSTTRFDHLEVHNIAPQVDPDTGRYTIVDTVRGTDAMWNPTTVRSVVSWADDFGNLSAGVPLFTFKDSSGGYVSPADAPANAAQVLITIVSIREGRSYQGSRIVFFRNK